MKILKMMMMGMKNKRGEEGNYENNSHGIDRYHYYDFKKKKMGGEKKSKRINLLSSS